MMAMECDMVYGCGGAFAVVIVGAGREGGVDTLRLGYLGRLS